MKKYLVLQCKEVPDGGAYKLVNDGLSSVSVFGEDSGNELDLCNHDKVKVIGGDDVSDLFIFAEDDPQEMIHVKSVNIEEGKIYDWWGGKWNFSKLEGFDRTVPSKFKHNSAMKREGKGAS